MQAILNKIALLTAKDYVIEFSLLECIQIFDAIKPINVDDLYNL